MLQGYQASAAGAAAASAAAAARGAGSVDDDEFGDELSIEALLAKVGGWRPVQAAANARALAAVTTSLRLIVVREPPRPYAPRHTSLTRRDRCCRSRRRRSCSCARASTDTCCQHASFGRYW